MNFKITHNWLKDYVDTNATPEEIQEHVSLSSANVETLEKVGDDTVYDIEVTSNRIDAASVIGFARECIAVLPRYDKTASFTSRPQDMTFSEIETGSEKSIDISIKDEDTVTRVAAIVLSDVNVGESPDFIRERLEAVGERSISNIVDISNYLRITLGQPVHTFDYDQIMGSSMSIEKSSEGDIVVLIDGAELKLPGNDVIIRDGEGRIIDLVGLMGGQNTGVSENTKNVLLFVPIVNKRLVRQTSMKTGHRTAAISYFEKGLDEEGVEATLAYGVQLMKEHCGARVSSEIYDMYPQKLEQPVIELDVAYVNGLMQTELSAQEMVDMITPLGFDAENVSDNSIRFKVPTWRAKDMTSQADIAEEVARIYGYHNLASHVQQTNVVYQPLDIRKAIDTREKVRDYLASVGYFEQYNYSMISQDLIEKMDMSIDEHLKLTDTISTEIEYMRRRLTQSLLKNIADNQGKADALRFFEVSSVYQKREGELPYEEERLCIVSQESYAHLKGIVENVLDVMKVTGVRFDTYGDVVECSTQSQLVHDDHDGNLGHVGKLSSKYQSRFGITEPVYIAEIRFAELQQYVQEVMTYEEPNPHAHIKFDHTYTSNSDNVYAELQKKAYEASELLVACDVIDTYENKVTVRFTFAAADRNLTESEAKEEFNKVAAIFN